MWQRQSNPQLQGELGSSALTSRTLRLGAEGREAGEIRTGEEDTLQRSLSLPTAPDFDSSGKILNGNTSTWLSKSNKYQQLFSFAPTTLL